MFAFDRSAAAVLLPLVLLVAVVMWSRHSPAPAAPQQSRNQTADPAETRAQTVAANLASR